MDWSAHSSVRVIQPEGKIKNSAHRKLFRFASMYVTRKAGKVDEYLEFGSLNSRECGDMLKRATNEDTSSRRDWNHYEVKRLKRLAKWKFEYKPEEAWAYWSARKFLEVCAEAGLSIRFS